MAAFAIVIKKLEFWRIPCPDQDKESRYILPPSEK